MDPQMLLMIQFLYQINTFVMIQVILGCHFISINIYHRRDKWETLLNMVCCVFIDRNFLVLDFIVNHLKTLVVAFSCSTIIILSLSEIY